MPEIAFLSKIASATPLPTGSGFSAGEPSSVLRILAVGVVAVVALYLGREVFVPVALAILLSFALAPAVLLLRRCHFGRVPSVTGRDAPFAGGWLDDVIIADGRLALKKRRRFGSPLICGSLVRRSPR